jgi:hypothetical protein
MGVQVQESSEEGMPMLRQQPGCIGGLLRLFLLQSVFGWLQRRFGFGQGCMGAGCGVIFLVIFVVLACSIFSGTNWFQLGGL